MAIMLAVLIIHGISPGPRLIIDQPELFWGVVMSFWIGNILLVILNVPLIGVWVKVLQVPYHLLYPIILLCTVIGVYTMGYTRFDIFTVIGFGILGYMMRVLRFHPAPLLIGFVLGPMVEEFFRRAMIISGGDVSTFFTRPMSASFLAITAVLLSWGVVSSLRARRRPAAVA